MDCWFITTKTSHDTWLIIWSLSKPHASVIHGLKEDVISWTSSVMQEPLAIRKHSHRADTSIQYSTLTRTIPMEEPVVKSLDQCLQILHHSFKIDSSLFLTQSYDTTLKKRHIHNEQVIWTVLPSSIYSWVKILDVLEQHSWQAISSRV